MQEMKNLLVPVMADTDSPPVDKLIDLAGRIKCKIHLAGFIANGDQHVDQLMKQTIILMQKVNSLSKRIKLNGGEVTSKLYMHTFKQKANKILEDQNIGIVTSSRDTYQEITKAKPGTIHLILKGKEDNSLDHDIIILNTVNKQQGRQIATISRIFGNKLYTVSEVSKETETDIKKYFKNSVESEINTKNNAKTLRDLLIKHDPGLIAIKKEEYRKLNKRQKILQEIEAPLLLY